VLRVKELLRHLCPDPGPGGGRDLGVGRCADQGVQVDDPLRHLDPERRRLIDDPERSAEPPRLLDGVQREVWALELLRAGVGEWVQAATEQVAHLLRGYRIARGEAVYTVHAGADPGAW
jgi:hypothetical protein